MLRGAVFAGDYAAAKACTQEIQELLRTTGHETRLMQAKVWLFEAALNSGELLTAESGFTGIRDKTARSTKVHLQATALLAVCFLRQKRLSEAEPLIAEVLNSRNIQSSGRRKNFVVALSRRYELEAYLAGVRNFGGDRLDVGEVDRKAVELMRAGKTEDELCSQIADALPREVIEYVFKVDRASRGLLTREEMLYLPPTANLQRKASQGRGFIDSPNWSCGNLCVTQKARCTRPGTPTACLRFSQRNIMLWP